MRVRDILRIKGNALYTISSTESLTTAVSTMSQHDIGSLVVVDHGRLSGILTFREIIKVLDSNDGSLGLARVGGAMDDAVVTCTPETDVSEVSRIMLEKHARYIPVLDGEVLMGVISFYDVAKAVLEKQKFENRMLKAYIRDWPVDADENADEKAAAGE